MKVYIFPRVQNLTYSYHAAGGLVVVALDPEHARELIRAEAEPPEDEDGFEPYSGLRHKVADDLDFRQAITYPTDKGVPAVVVFPDAGCC